MYFQRILKMTKYLVKDFDEEEGLPSWPINGVENNKISEENLLAGLSNWLDRLFEGMTDRYYINYWPDFSTK